MFENDFHALPAVQAQHLDRRLQFSKRHDMADKRLQPHSAPLDQINGARVVFTPRRAGVDKSQLLEIELIKRQGSLNCGIDAKSKTRPPKRAMVVASASDTITPVVS